MTDGGAQTPRHHAAKKGWLYDELINPIDPLLRVDAYLVGTRWTMVRSADRVGVGSTISAHGGPANHSGQIRGAALKQIATLAKSWNWFEASLGVAALTCYYNQAERLASLGAWDADRPAADQRRGKSAFDVFADQVTGKKVTVVGHFPGIEKDLGEICQLQILEREPRSGDYSDTACEFLLHDQDFLFITGMTLINKSLPRLLELAPPHCTVSLIGPSVPAAPVFFEAGVTNLSGFCVTEPDLLDDLVRRGSRTTIFDAGVMFSLSPDSI